jgi:hypothetical protein
MWILAFLAAGLLVVLLIVGDSLRQRRFRTAKWDDLVAQLESVPRIAIEQIALDHLQPEASHLKYGPAELWTMIGGMDGLCRLRHNAGLLIALAAYMRQWNFTEAVIVAELIRHDSHLLKRAVFRIQMESAFHMLFGRGLKRTPFYLRQASSAYYLMRQRVLVLYQNHQFVLYPQLANVV